MCINAASGRHRRLLLAGAILVLSCTRTETIEVSREPYNSPADASNGFLGLYVPGENQTTCGNCHVGTQGQWESSGHAAATAELLAGVANPPPACFGCHALTERGNRIGLAGRPGGWNVVPDSSYHNVQCESCHGPGLDHVRVPDDRANLPLARVGLRDSLASCAACHSGGHAPFAEQWAQSGHADSAALAYPAGRPECQGCHEGRAAIRRFSGRGGSYVEVGAPAADNMPITCAVCHDPHGSPNSAQLRAPVTTPDIAVNLCMQCHNRNSQPAASFTPGARGPHSAQGGVFLGQGAGWLPPGFAVDTTLIYQTTHVGGNPRLCAGCHVADFDVTDPATGNLVFKSVGHLFAPNPCLDANGVPSARDDCGYTAVERSWAGCTTSGCHTATAAAALFNVLDGEVSVLVDQLWADLNGNQILDAAPTDGGYLAAVRAAYPGNDSAAFCCTGAASDNRLSVAEGALFNALMLGRDLYDGHDGSRGVHNPAFYKALLAASIASVQATYLLPAPGAQVRALIDRALRHPAIRFAAPHGMSR